jgi:beta-1,4-mannosyl-glycoprotein beta-1,4-N-acetylglucosaminyltransferase
MMKWIDTIMFNGEPVVKLRLQLLYPHVDRFYISEQRYTHQGARKDELFIEKYKEWFTEYNDKITFLIDEKDYSKETYAWTIENAQRNYPIPHILEDNSGQDYICSVCDCDEIPDWRAVHAMGDKLYNLCNTGAVIMDQQLFYYNLNWGPTPWKRAFFLNNRTVEIYKDFQLFREIDNQGPVAGHFSCGWHFSYFMHPSDIIRKIESFAHREVNKDSFKSKDHVKECIMNGKDLYGRDYPLPKNNSFDYPNEIMVFHYTLLAIQYAAF